jgi:anthranilate phosphoribosyltransferase
MAETDDAVGKLTAGSDLTQAEMAGVIDEIMRGQCPPERIALILTALRDKGETFAEVAGAAQAMRQHMTPIRSRHTGLLDTCGTGGDGSSTFNISTAAAFVTAAAGVPVAKHGNRSITSLTGSADVLAALGVNIEALVPVVERCLNEVGIAFCFAPQLHPAMKHVGAMRKSLGFPTIFNLLGPLCNPANAAFQVLGVGKKERHRLLADALALLQPQRAVVVCGEDGLDEVALGAATRVYEVTGSSVREFLWQPEDFGIERAGRETMLVQSAPESAAMIKAIFAGEKGPPRDIVVLNSAAALWVAGKTTELKQAARLAQEAIDSGAAAAKVAALAEASRRS